VVTVANPWITSNADFARQHPASPTGHPNRAGITETANGPAATHFATLLRRAGLQNLCPNALELVLTDHKSPGAPVSAQVVCALEDGRGLHATQQQLIFPLSPNLIGIHDTAKVTERPTGSVLIARPHELQHQVILITSAGLFTQVTAWGVPALDLDPALSIEQLTALMTAMDS
jgi:hypothetical protein